MDHFNAFHAKIQILANLNESIVNSHFPDRLGETLGGRRILLPCCSRMPSSAQEVEATTRQAVDRGPPTALPRLPLEVIELIVRDMTRRQLMPVLLSNKSLHSVAIRTFYRELVETSPRRILTLLLHLSRTTSPVHQYIRKIDFNLTTLECPTANFYRLLRGVLLRTGALVSLSLDLPKTQSPVWIFAGVRFKLKQFSTSMHCTPELARFLDGQERITHLTLRGFHKTDARQCLPDLYRHIAHSIASSHGNNNNSNANGDAAGGSALSSLTKSLRHPHARQQHFMLAPGSLPNLTTFNAIHAGPALVREVVRGRPVKVVSIPLFVVNARSSLEALEEGSVPLQRLSLISFDPDAPTFIFEEVAKRFKELEALHIVVLLAEFSNDSLLEARRYLRSFKRLRYITCVATSSEESSLVQEQEIAERWQEECPSLRTIILPRGRVWFQRPAGLASANGGGGGARRWECLDDV